MKHEERWHELNELPIEPGKKQAIYRAIRAESSVGRRSSWKEIIVTCGVMALAFFLFFVPQLERQSATTDSSALYIYADSEADYFQAKPSSLYVGMHKITDAALLDFVATITAHVEPGEQPESFYGKDVLFVQGGTEHRYKLGYEGVLDWDTGAFYISNSFTYRDAYVALRESVRPPNYMFLPLIIIAVNVGTALIYRWTATVRPKFPIWFHMLPLIWIFMVIYIMGFQEVIGPFWKPYLGLMLLGYALFNSLIMMRLLINPLHRRVECTGLWLMVLTLGYMFWQL